jgi:hypothetical protein
LHLICSNRIEDDQKTLHNFLSWMTPGNDDAGMALSGRDTPDGVPRNRRDYE